MPVKISNMYRSIAFGRFIKATLIISAFFLLFYMIYYIYTVIIGTEDVVMDFLFFKGSLLVAIPFILILFIFFLSIYIYALYIDINNIFGRFHHSPTGAMFWSLLPVLNLVGWGLVFSRVINYLDEEWRDEFYDKKSLSLKFSISFFYAGIMGILLSLAFTLSLYVTPENFTAASFLIYNAVQFIFICSIIGGLYMLIDGYNSVIQYRAMKLLMERENTRT